MHEYLIALVRAVIKGKKAPDCSEDIDIQALAKLSEMHQLVPIVYSAAASNLELAQKLNKAYMISITKSATQDIEAEKVIEAYEKAGIFHIPLKGYVIKNLYPSPEMRESTDFDVYVPVEFNRKACEVMAALGYSYDEKSIGLGMHDEYSLGAMMAVEVHKSLMAPDFPKWCKLCDEIVRNATLCEGYKYRYEFSKEDYYLYMQLHTIKHLKYSSCGIKAIVDIWVYLSKYKEELNWDYIRSMLKKGGLVEIDENLRNLSAWWFDDVEPKNPIIYRLGEYIINSGAFGTEEQYLSGRKTDDTKFKRLWRAFFLPLDEMKIKYPILKKAPVLLPFFWIYRTIYAALFKREVSKEFLNKGANIEDSKAEALSEFKRKIGL